MISILSKVLKYVLILTALFGVILFGILFFINPSNYKNTIISHIQEYTGQKCTINGSINIKFGKTTELHVTDISLPASADGILPAIDVKDAVLSFDLLSLFEQELNVITLTLTNVDFHFNTGQTTQAAATHPQKSMFIQKMKINNVTIGFTQSDINLPWKIQNATLSSDDVSIVQNGKLPLIALKGELLNTNSGSVYNIDTKVNADLLQHSLTFDPLTMLCFGATIQGASTISQINTSPLIEGNLSLNNTNLGSLLKQIDPYMTNTDLAVSNTIGGTFTYNYDPKQSLLDLSAMTIQLDGGSLNGNIKLTHVAPYQTEFSFDSTSLNIRPLFMLVDALFPPLPSNNFLPFALLQQLTVNGKFNAQDLTLGPKLKLDHATLQIVGKDGIMMLNPVNISAHGDSHNLSLKIDLSQPQPTFKFIEQSDQVNIEDWAQILNLPRIFTGKASIKAELSATGKDVTALQNTVSGDINIQIKDGNLKGIDMPKLLAFATSMVNEVFSEYSNNPTADLTSMVDAKAIGWIKTQQDRPITPFKNFELKAHIERGNSTESSISLSSDVCELKGTGQFDLPNNTLNYEAFITQIQAQQGNISALNPYLQKNQIPLLINGALYTPTYGPNIQNFAIQVLNVAQTDFLNQAISLMVGMTPPNQKTSKTASELFIASLESLK